MLALDSRPMKSKESLFIAQSALPLKRLCARSRMLCALLWQRPKPVRAKNEARHSGHEMGGKNSE